MTQWLTRLSQSSHLYRQMFWEAPRQIYQQRVTLLGGQSHTPLQGSYFVSAVFHYSIRIDLVSCFSHSPFLKHNQKYLPYQQGIFKIRMKFIFQPIFKYLWRRHGVRLLNIWQFSNSHNSSVATLRHCSITETQMFFLFWSWKGGLVIMRVGLPVYWKKSLPSSISHQSFSPFIKS